MHNILEIDDNSFTVVEAIHVTITSMVRRLVGSKWSVGISSQLAKGIHQEFLMFSLWIIFRRVDDSKLEKMEKMFVRSNLSNHCLSDESKEVFPNRKKLYNSYYSEKIINQLGSQDPLTALFFYLTDYWISTSSHFKEEMLDGRNLIPMMNSFDNDTKYIAALYFVLDEFSRTLFSDNLICETPSYAKPRIQNLLNSATKFASGKLT